MKNAALIIMPLIFSSISRIDTIGNAMELRAFGKNKRRTWYRARPFELRDYLTIIIGVVIVVLVFLLSLSFQGGSQFYNSFK